jgi:protein O-mannosyl-transferase
MRQNESVCLNIRMSFRAAKPVRLATSSIGARWLMPGLCLLLVVLVLLVFGQCLRFEFVNYDDYTFVLKNEHVLRGLTWENGRWALTAGVGANTADIDYWRPLSMMSHMLDVHWFGLKASAHHAVSVGLHALTA